jgi:hypothetical protein
MSPDASLSVIPAKAGLHTSLKTTASRPWMSACAGMTMGKARETED